MCPRCAQRKRARDTYRTWAWACAALFLIPAAVWVGILPRNLWMTMGWGGVMLSMYVSVLPHEFGHALMARAVGYRPLAIVWGGFPPLIDRKIFGIRTMIGLAPESGFACFEPVGDRWARLKMFAITAAGPLTNAAIAVLSFVAAIAIDESFTRSIPKFTLLVFGVANAWLALGNLWPTTVSTAAGNVPSDGSRLLSYLGGKPIDHAMHRAAASQMRLFFLFRDEAYDQVLAEADAAEASFGPAPWIQVGRSAALCNLHRPGEAREMLLGALELPEMRSDAMALAFAENNLAWANFVIDDPAHDADSLERTSRSMALLPWLAPVVITRCSVLASRGVPGSARVAEAQALLSRVHELELNKAARIGIAIVEGLLAAANGDGGEARRRLEAARRIGDPGLAGCVLEARLPSN